MTARQQITGKTSKCVHLLAVTVKPKKHQTILAQLTEKTSQENATPHIFRRRRRRRRRLFHFSTYSFVREFMVCSCFLRTIHRGLPTFHKYEATISYRRRGRQEWALY